jgi:hypothetical protein
VSNLIFPRAQFCARRNTVTGSATLSIVIGLAAAALIAVAVIAVRPPASRLTAKDQAATAATVAQKNSQADHAHINANFAALPLAFEPNVGQSDSAVRYSARGRGYSLFLTSNGAYFARPIDSKPEPGDVRQSVSQSGSQGPAARALRNRAVASPREHFAVASVQMNMLGSNPNPQITAENVLPGVTNYMQGRDRSKWHSGVAHYGQVRYHDIYPGVDLAFHGASHREDKFEFDFVVNPGAKPEAVTLGFSGLTGLRTTASGDLVLASAAGDLDLHRPFGYQESNGVRQAVDARFVIQANNRVSFALGNYDRSRQVIIDPTVTYSTYLGGALEDDADAITIDSSGNAYITGETDSADFSGTTGATVGTFDVLVSKLSPTGTLLFTTLVGGTSEDVGNAIVVDSTGIYVAGRTSSSDFPTLSGPQTTFLAGTNHGFVFKLSSVGSTLAWSTLVEGSVGDSVLGLAVDANHEAYVVGDTVSPDLGSNSAGNGTVNPLTGGSSLNNGNGGASDDGFIAKLSSDGTQYLFLSYLGGSGIDIAEGAAIDSAGNVYVAGLTQSTDFPVTQGAFQTTCGTDTNCNAASGSAFDDAFVTAISPGNTPTFIYSTYLGGENTDDAFAIAVDSNRNTYITGQTFSSKFPTKNPLTGIANPTNLQKTFVASLNSTGTSLNYSTYLGGSGNEQGDGIAVDTNGNAYVTGLTNSTDFPTASATQASFAGGNTDAFVSELNLNGASLSLPFSTYLGGKGDEDFVYGAIAVDGAGNIYVTGNTNSSNFPLSTGAFDGTYNAGATANCVPPGDSSPVPCPDVFVTVYAPNADFSIAGTPLSSVSAGGSSTSTITITPFNGYNQTVTFTCSVSGGGTPAPQCTNPSSVSGGSGTTTLTVTTTAATAKLALPGAGHGTIFYASLFFTTLMPVFGFAVLGLVSSTVSGKKRLAAFLCLFVLLSGLLVLPACGGGSSSGGGGGGGGGSAGTPAGTYTITVTGTDGTITHSITPALTLTVN